MLARSPDLHGSAPDTAPLALLLIDFINDLEFEDGPALLQPALAAAKRTAALKARAADAGIPVIYANDNFGRWQSNFKDVVAYCLEHDVRGRPLVEQLRPTAKDYFILKPKNSAFYQTTLSTLLKHLGAERLVLTGITVDICILFTAMDAYLRDFQLHIPSDCVAAVEAQYRDTALQYAARALKADIRPSTEIDLSGAN